MSRIKITAGQCVHNMSGICSHGKYMNYRCIGSCPYFMEATDTMADSWNSKGYISVSTTDPAKEEDIQKQSFEEKRKRAADLDELAELIDQDELYLFDKLLQKSDITADEYTRLYLKAYERR